MSLEEHRDVVTKPLGRLFYIITKTFFYPDEEKNSIVSSGKHYSVLEKAL
jgi:hypothetical protein